MQRGHQYGGQYGGQYRASADQYDGIQRTPSTAQYGTHIEDPQPASHREDNSDPDSPVYIDVMDRPSGRPLMQIAGYKKLSTPDAILNKGIEDELKKFMANGGSLQDGLDALIEGYEGVPDMVTSLLEWTNIFDDGETVLESTLETLLEENEQSIIPRIDEALLLGDKPPDFLHELNASQRWRPVLSKIGDRHRNSALFNYLARSARLEDAGVDQDIVTSPQAFLAAISSEVSDLLAKEVLGDKDIKEFYKKMRNLCTYDESSTTVAVRIFASLSLRAENVFLKRLFRRTAQEIREEAVRVMQSVAGVGQSTAVQFAQRLAILVEAVASGGTVRKDVLDAIVGLVTRDRIAGRRYETETTVLNQTYKSLLGEIFHGEVQVEGETNMSCFEEDDAIERKMLVGMLCHAEIFDAMLQAVFTYEKRSYNSDKKVDEKRRNCLCLLLSYAGTFISVDTDTIVSRLQDPEKVKELRTRANELRQQLEKVAAVVEELQPGCPRFKIKGKAVQVLLSGIEQPLIAKGVLHWARESLEGGSDQRVLLITGPRYLAFVEAIAEKHVTLRGEVLDVLHYGFSRHYPMLDVLDAEKLRDMYLKCLTNMVRLHMAKQVMDLFHNQYANDPTIDLAHLRRFVRDLLEMVEPPYTAGFVRFMLTLLGHPRIADATSAETSTKNLVINFRQVARRMNIVGEEVFTPMVSQRI